ncbi:2-phospho-L-lactate transferase [Rubrobacter radiotolerans]|uniref:2-phospho-L-lactate transferase n=1 Tax=Rubrobacter radiotolerans TaxID=42256 RepID=A0A023X1T1_RUBRA|nr:2-phospho-L-lactate transferase [Rubrobacter radiotolerans]AHY46151.1 2-phospho-L-lactate transferase [Rubrobacter radiotolerans]MDX5893561.1 2-phospho-L-lactate transferase [Rubrobacter radiotolerans]SMC03985.1 LPPG:FO 2-phospho-L-lactate transferase [Rubrobacter radiotolerans DSM 5868]
MKVVALAGGVGGAKLAAGLAACEELSVVVNTADDFELWGLHVSPDLDTVMYTLAGLANPETGWGVRDETFRALEMISTYGGEAWFRIGDRDLATHVLRTERLRRGEGLTEVTAALCAGLGVESRVLPMSDESVATVVESPAGDLEFQEYFVGRGQRDEVLGVRFRGIEDARPTDEVAAAAREAEAVVLCPSNPVVSLGPILAVPGMREVLEGSGAPTVAVSPIVGGRAIKGPADRMLASLGHEASARGVARLYEGLVDGFVIDRVDVGEKKDIEALGMEVLVTEAVMRDEPDRARLAEEVLRFAARVGGNGGERGPGSGEQ